MSLVQVQQLVKRFGGMTAVNGLNFEIGQGRCIALLGPNGAGKTTTLKMLAGLLKPTEGTIRFEGGSGDIRNVIGFLPQYPAFFGWMSGREYLTFAGRLAHLSKAEARSRTEELLETVGLKDAGKRRIGGYSGGMKQRLGIAQALIHRPKLLMLDEPVSALDPIGRREVLEMIRHIQQHTTVLFSTHVLHDAEEVCDDILIMNKGNIVVNGSLSEVRTKYCEPVILVQAETPLADSAERWRALPGVTAVEANGYDARIIVADMAQARAELWRDAADRNLPVVRFEAGRMTLEDVFMKAVEA